MTSDLAAIEARHVPAEGGCSHRYGNRTTRIIAGCDTAILLARLREVEHERDEARNMTSDYATLYNDTVAERDAARADGDRLAEALRLCAGLADQGYRALIARRSGAGPALWGIEAEANGALAAHEAAK
jgi:hypothetical protein